jgi:radical SAM superfamily enzyme YgiQ (UPF0313 family)
LQDIDPTVGARPPRRFLFVLIKPSHYGDDGYVIRWWRTTIPSNSLAAVYGIASDCAERQVLGTDVGIDIDAIDEINTRVDVPALLERFKRNGGFGLVGLIGVQSNQYPRALDLARQFRAEGVPVIIGGFHVSGCLSMLDGRAVELDQCRELGVSMFAGEAEGRLDTILRDAAENKLQPLYNFMNDLPGIEGTPVPFLPKRYVERTLGLCTSFDAGRGCPYQCSFCTIINVQGRKSRRRSADDVERTIREHYVQGIRHFFITDDNLARNKDWEAIFDRIIMLRERENMNIRLMVQVDTLCHKIPNFIEKAARAGTNRVLVGLESINAANLLAAKKRQNKITEYRTMLLAWKNAGAITTAGYILGFPFDTPESIREDIAIIQRELPLDILEFFCLTPLPGSEDHKVLWQKGEWMHEDMNLYDGEHAVAHHPKMSKDEWEQVYRAAWETYYTPEHMETILRRGASVDCSMSRLVSFVFLFCSSVPLENAHPLQGGLLRRKYRLDRRPGLPIEPIWSFYPKYAWNFVTKYARAVRLLLWLHQTNRRIQRDPNRYTYTDLAMTPVTDDETERLELFTHSDAARDAVAHVHKIEQLTGTNRHTRAEAPA